MQSNVGGGGGGGDTLAQGNKFCSSSHLFLHHWLHYTCGILFVCFTERTFSLHCLIFFSLIVIKLRLWFKKLCNSPQRVPGMALVRISSLCQCKSPLPENDFSPVPRTLRLVASFIHRTFNVHFVHFHHGHSCRFHLKWYIVRPLCWWSLLETFFFPQQVEGIGIKTKN